jgi:hypothetical protein
MVEVVAPPRYVRRYVKPAGWRFTERAYTTWTRTTTASASATDDTDVATGGGCDAHTVSLKTPTDNAVPPPGRRSANGAGHRRNSVSRLGH